MLFSSVSLLATAFRQVDSPFSHFIMFHIQLDALFFFFKEMVFDRRRARLEDVFRANLTLPSLWASVGLLNILTRRFVMFCRLLGTLESYFKKQKKTKYILIIRAFFDGT